MPLALRFYRSLRAKREVKELAKNRKGNDCAVAHSKETSYVGDYLKSVYRFYIKEGLIKIQRKLQRDSHKNYNIETVTAEKTKFHTRRGVQFSPKITKLLIQLCKTNLSEPVIRGIIQEVYGIRISKRVLWEFRVHYGIIHAWHKWEKQVGSDKKKCKYCGKEATIQEIHNGHLPPCEFKLMFKTSSKSLLATKTPKPVVKPLCDDCKKEEAQYFSLGGNVFCKPCADKIGLVCGEKNRIDDNNPDWLVKKAQRSRRLAKIIPKLSN